MRIVIMLVALLLVGCGSEEGPKQDEKEIVSDNDQENPDSESPDSESPDSENPGPILLRFNEGKLDQSFLG